MATLRALLLTFSRQDMLQHRWRTLVAVLAIALGVALALAVQLINASAMAEFDRAARALGGRADLQLRARQGALPEQLYADVAQLAQVQRASPVLELQAQLQHSGASVTLRVLGVDALQLATLAPDLMPRPWPQSPRLAMLAPATLFLNPAALAALQWRGDTPAQALLQAGSQRHGVQVAGIVAAAGTPLAVMDIGAAQDLFGRGGWLSRIDLQLRPGVTREPLESALLALPGWPANALLVTPAEHSGALQRLTRAYRVNLAALSLVALFTGAFLVYSVLALGVARRQPQLALLAVLGATPGQRLALVLLEALALGLVGSLLGLLLGTALAAGALHWLGADLGAGYFAGVAPALHWNLPALLVYGLLGLLAALVGGWWPARAASALAPAQALKGLDAAQPPPRHATGPWLGPALCAAGALLAFVPAVAGVPLAAYTAIGLLLVGGMALLPLLVQALVAVVQQAQRRAGAQPLRLLALARAGHARNAAVIAVGGVVAALALAVALMVMVGSFRASLTQWLAQMLPAPLYLQAGGSDGAPVFGDDFVAALRGLPEFAQVQGRRSLQLQIDARLPALALLARPLDTDVQRTLPLQGDPSPVPPGCIGVYASEAAAALYQIQPGQHWPALAAAWAQQPDTPSPCFFIAGIWRDYARQSGAVVLDSADLQRVSGERGASELALWPAPGISEIQAQNAIEGLALRMPDMAQLAALRLTSAQALRSRSLAIFDRSFAITHWLQAVAIGIGLFGVASSMAAQVLARRKEFGMLAHLGFTRGQILALVAGEGLVWSLVGALAGMLLGLAVSLVLVYGVNPQSFHWSMDLAVPWTRLSLLVLATVAAAALTSLVAGRAAAGADAVQAVRQDW